MSEHWDALVLGGGFYGLYLAEHLAHRYGRVLLCEREADPMQRASYANQARVHNGYHYPRSLLTALRSRVNFPRFVEEFRPTIDHSFTNVYAVARHCSKVSAEQFLQFIKRIGAPIQPASAGLQSLFEPSLIEQAFLTQEFVFNSITLKNIMLERVRKAGVEIRPGASATRLRQAPGDAIDVELSGAGIGLAVIARRVFCCAYSQLNFPIVNSGLECVPLRHEIAELALTEAPEPLRHLGVTVMDGLFFSYMPFPARGLHSLSHVRYTPHCHWFDSNANYVPPYQILDGFAKRTAFPQMLRDACRYLPVLRDCRYRNSLWEVKTLLPVSESDDSRPILFRRHHGLRNFHVILGGKIDNVYDVLGLVDQELGRSGGR